MDYSGIFSSKDRNTVKQHKFHSEKFSIIFSAMGIFVALVFVSNSAFATCDATNTSICINWGSSPYYVDHGGLITVTDPNKINAGSITVTVNVPTLTNPPTYTVILNESPAGSGKFSGYVYFNDDTEYPSSNSNNVINSPHIEVGALGSGVRVSAYYTFSGGYVSQQTVVTSAMVDNAGNGNWPWPTLTINSPSPHTQPSTLQNNCAAGDSTSGDFICDSWKKQNGEADQGLKIPWTNKDGTISMTNFYKYPCDPKNPPFSGSLVGSSTTDPQCPVRGSRDIYVEIDYLTGHKPDLKALDAVITSFANQGIRLHIQLDEEIPFHKDSISVSALSIAGGAGNTEFDLIKQYYFGTSSDRNNPTDSSSYGYQPNLTAKRQVFHYALFIHSQDSSSLTSSGASEMPGNDIGISLGRFTGGIGSLDMLKGTFMHELGHNLGLHHGGDEDKNCKPNYLSVMNYNYQDVFPVSNRQLDYSHGVLNTLKENSLTDTDGIFSSDKVSEVGQNFAWGYNPVAGQPYGPGNYIQYGTVGTSTGKYGLDWDRSMPNPPDDPDQYDSNTVISNIPVIAGCTASTADTNMYDYNDWGNLNFNMKGTSAWSDGMKVVIPGTHPKIIPLKHLTYPTWVLNWIKTYGLKRMKGYEEPSEITALDIREFRSLQILGVIPVIDRAPISVFSNSTDKSTIENDLVVANMISRTGDLPSTSFELAHAKKDVKDLVVNKGEQKTLLRLLDNVLSSHDKTLVNPTFYKHDRN